MVGLSDHNFSPQDDTHWAGIQYSIDFITQRVERRKLFKLPYVCWFLSLMALTVIEQDIHLHKTSFPLCLRIS